MVLGSRSRSGHSEVVVSAEIHPERPGVAPRPEPEIEQPEIEFVLVVGPSSDLTAVGTSFPSPPLRVAELKLSRKLCRVIHFRPDRNRKLLQ